MTRERHVRICERLGVQFPGPTWLENTYFYSERGAEVQVRLAQHLAGFEIWQGKQG